MNTDFALLPPIAKNESEFFITLCTPVYDKYEVRRSSTQSFLSYNTHFVAAHKPSDLICEESLLL